MQPGRASSHLSRFALHSWQPVRDLVFGFASAIGGADILDDSDAPDGGKMMARGGDGKEQDTGSCLNIHTYLAQTYPQIMAPRLIAQLNVSYR